MGKNKGSVYAAWLPTALGDMLAVSDEAALLLLSFVDTGCAEAVVRKRLKLSQDVLVVFEKTLPILHIKRELDLYFLGRLQAFLTPLCLIGSPFQRQVWHALMQIPYGQAWSYREQARHIGRVHAFRAVANANAANPLAIVVPCHRVIRHNGETGGYRGGKIRKAWLMAHEGVIHRQ